MCGIFGYVGNKNAKGILIDGLKTLEYRGYDSAGIVVASGEDFNVAKAVGEVVNLEDKTINFSRSAKVGISHTRWATHGAPSEANAHPHSDCEGNIWIAHNGIIENYEKLKANLKEKGHRFKSETDSEVIAHLIEEVKSRLGSSLEEAV